MKKLTFATTLCASVALSSPAFAWGQSAVWWDGLSFLYQLGPTPDTVQSELNPSLGPDIVDTSNQHMSVWLKVSPLDMNSLEGIPKDFLTIYGSKFPNDTSTGTNGVIVALLADSTATDNSGRATVYASACSDTNCTDYISGWALNAFPIDEAWHNLQVFFNLEAGTMHLQIDTQDDYPSAFGDGGVADGNPVYWSGNSFSTPVDGMWWEVACDNGWLPFGKGWSPLCFSGDMAELWVYSGPQYPATIDVASSAFWRNDGQLIRANSLDSSSGIAVFGDYPTIYMRGGPQGFIDANAYDFSALGPPAPVLPWIVGTIDDIDLLHSGSGPQASEDTPY